MSRLRFATNVTVTVLATLVVSSIAYAGAAGAHAYRTASEPHPMPPQAKESPLPLPLPSAVPSPGGLYVIDEDLIDVSTGWMLVSDCPLRANPTCHNAVVGTEDGGQTWTAPAAVGPQVAVTDGGMPRTIRFLNRHDGFVYGANAAFVTHDGGKTWAAVAIPAVFVDSIAMWGDVVWVATHPCPKGSPCSDELRSSIDGGRTWSTPRRLPPGFIPEQAAAFVTGAMFATEVAPFTILLTTDRGTTWRQVASGCPQSSFNDFVASSNGVELWAICWPYPDSAGIIAAQSLFVSEDGGKTWAERKPGSPLQLPGWLVTPRPRVAFLSSNNVTAVTHDGGVTWTRPVDENVTFATVRFTSVGWGWALDAERNVWSSSSGGDHWIELGSLPDRLS